MKMAARDRRRELTKELTDSQWQHLSPNLEGSVLGVEDSSTKLLTTGGGLDGISEDSRSSLKGMAMPSAYDGSDDDFELDELKVEVDSDGRDLSVPNLTDYDLLKDERSLLRRIKEDILCNGNLYAFAAYHSLVFFAAKNTVELVMNPLMKAQLRKGLVLNAFNPLVSSSAKAAAASSTQSMPTKIESILSEAFDSKFAAARMANRLMSLTHSLVAGLSSVHFFRKYRRTLSQAQDPAHYRYAADELAIVDHTLAFTLADTLYLLYYEPHNVSMLWHHVFAFLLATSTRIGGFGAPVTNMVLICTELPTVVLNFALISRDLAQRCAAVLAQLSSQRLARPSSIEALRKSLLRNLKGTNNAMFVLFASVFAYGRMYLLSKVLRKAVFNIWHRGPHLHPAQNMMQITQVLLLLFLSYLWGFVIVRKALAIIRLVSAYYSRRSVK